MGTWGPGNLDSDSAQDELADRAHELVESILKRARCKEGRDEGEYEGFALFVDFEMAFALDAKKLLTCNNFPSPEEVEELKADFIRDWEDIIEGYDPQADYKKDRRRCILRTFNRFKKICVREHERRKEQDSVEWTCDTPPSPTELLGTDSLVKHTAIEGYQILIPESWNVAKPSTLDDVPDFLVSSLFWDSDEQRFVVRAIDLETATKSETIEILKDAYQIDSVFFASGRSLHDDVVPNAINPYILLANLRPDKNVQVRDLHDLIFGCNEWICEQGYRQYAGSPYSFDTASEMEFLLLNTHHPSDDLMPKPMHGNQNLHLHTKPDGSLLLMETNAVDGIRDYSHDNILVNALRESLTTAESS